MTKRRMGVPDLHPEVVEQDKAAQVEGYDALLVVTSSADALQSAPYYSAYQTLLKVDASAGSGAAFVASDKAPGGRVVVSFTGPLNRDYDDVRRFQAAAKAAINRATAAGSVRPLLQVLGVPARAEYAHALEVSLLAVLQALYEPLQAREADGSLEKVDRLGFVAQDKEQGERIAHYVRALEEGRRVARDIGSGDPERMTPLKALEYIENAFKGSDVVVSAVTSREELEKEYPLAAAVGRASYKVERHKPVIVRLTYVGPGETEQTLLLAGKGIVYDTGGADIKYGGHMAGMHMDKGGAAGFAGFVKTVSLLKPKGLKVVSELAFVRNSSGSDNYVADEIIRSHAGVRVAVGNTDAEGRMVLTDCVSHLREVALKEKSCHIMTCATLTGHAGRAVGPYSITLDNGPAHSLNLSGKLQAAGSAWGDEFEVSRLRREDYDFIAPKNSAYDVLQCNNAASSATDRGHQFPAAFIIIASGLAAHGIDSSHPIPFSHLDIAGSACEDDDYQFGKPTATPVLALTARYVLDRI